MSNLAIINQIIADKYKPSKQSALIEEDKDENGKPFKQEYSIVKRNPNIEYALYRFTVADFPYFKDISSLKKMCDYILFIEEKNNFSVFVIELKLSNESAHKQLNAAKEFVDFIIKSAARVDLKIGNYNIKKIRICDSKVSKKNKNLKEEDIYKFDKDNYIDYQVSTSFLIEPLLYA